MEQWEINLRKLLEEKNAVRETRPEKLDVKVSSNSAMKPSSFSDNIMILVALVLLGIIVVFALDHKSGDKLQGLFHAKLTFFSKNDERIQHLEEETREIHEKFTSLLKEYDRLSSKVEANVSKTNLMGFLLNENFMIIRDNKDKSQFIFFKRDWKLNHMPQFIKLNEEDLQYLQKYIAE